MAAQYLLQITYTPEAWAALVNNPHARIEAIRPALEKLGGKMHHAWFAFGITISSASWKCPAMLKLERFRPRPAAQ